jgi:hypothetical protein
VVKLGHPAEPAGAAVAQGLCRRQADQSARAYISGLGYYKLYINETRIGDHELDPAFTSYGKTVL